MSLRKRITRQLSETHNACLWVGFAVQVALLDPLRAELERARSELRRARSFAGL